MADGSLNLRESLRLANSILATPAVAQMMSFALEDPLRLNLPPIIGNGSSSLTPDAPTLRVMATLYLQAELEQAGIIAVAEVLTDSRYQLAVRDMRTGKLLEDFFRQRRDWLDRNSREHIFARVFGFGAVAGNQQGAAVNRDFMTKFANFCLALRRIGEDLKWQKTPSTMLDSAFRQTAADLLVNLGSRGYGDLFEATKRIQNQLSKAIEILSDEGIGNAFQTRGMWNLLNLMLSPNTPDFARLTTRGQCGLRLLDWLASILPKISDRNYQKPLVEAISPSINWAEMWLEATGFNYQPKAFRRAA